MNPETLKQMLEAYRRGQMELDEVMSYLRDLPYKNLEFARIDNHRQLRQGFPEVIFGQGKTTEQIIAIIESMLQFDGNILVTRTSEAVFDQVRAIITDAEYHPSARMIRIIRQPAPRKHGHVAVVAAGTSDLPVAEEAAMTADTLGNPIDRFYDVGVAGVHRLLSIRDQLIKARVVICVAGMEGALPSVVGGLVGVPVIAVPTSIGYGASFGGLAALLSMLNSCASNVVVVNIDNGFSAGVVAHLINQ
ncbi:MAG: nickel pincer cofactor biosynthesis protein LarB [Acidobacteriota bacterium]|nr:nickel pincer cofactor biosynthesis protein LarB [Blastocatellia bacterium]MDW8239356.1 nickel pincer cofactor biosynthesis protein LarB [Acidobacteriota bacterium]